MDERPWGRRRVLLLRHGQSEAQVLGTHIFDPVLTDLGCQQAKAWQGAIREFGVEVVLVSPLRRAVQTACLAFALDDTPLRLCRCARERWWTGRDNTLGSVGSLRSALNQLPRGSDVKGLRQALRPGPGDPNPQTEEESIAFLRRTLAESPEHTVAVVCHRGVIGALCGIGAENCEVLECEWNEGGRLQVLCRHFSPLTADWDWR